MSGAEYVVLDAEGALLRCFDQRQVTKATLHEAWEIETPRFLAAEER